MGYRTYDLIFLAVFIAALVIFLVTRKKNLERHFGIAFLYKTKVGIKFIEKFSKKFEKILGPSQYLILAVGYFLMAGIIYVLVRFTYLYLSTPIARLLPRTPPVAPLIPYFPELFGLESFLPPLPFIIFIIAIATILIPHEFAHGIYARLNKIKIHATGFAFFGPFLGAFVEQDEKQMIKAKKFSQLSILGAGTFANVVVGIIFLLLFWVFFTNAFAPSGVIFHQYPITQVEVPAINVIGNTSISEELVEIEVNGKTFFADRGGLQQATENNLQGLYVFEDSPALRAQIIPGSAIMEIDGRKTTSLESLQSAIQSYNPGDKVKIKAADIEMGKGTKKETKEYEVEFGEKDGKTILGVGFLQPQKGFIEFFLGFYYKVKNPLIFYESKIGDFGLFMFYLFFWILVISFLIALFNMLPLGILDGGRFFYISVWGLTGSEKFARRAFKFMTWFILALVVVLLGKWISIFF